MARARRRLPGEKEKLPDARPESLMSVLKAVAQFVLMILGIIGLATAIFSDEGWLVQLARKATQADSFDFIVLVPLLLIGGYVGKVWFERSFGKSSAAVTGNLAMYLMMAVGAFFLFRLLTTGSFTGA